MTTTVKDGHAPAELGACGVAVVIPCYNEETAIADVVAGFRAALPDADIYVIDNASTDQTTARAEAAGAQVRHEPLKGKGNAVRRAFADIEADIFIMVDGDGTYEPTDAPAMIEKLRQDTLDMVVGVRRNKHAQAYRPGHVTGNRVISGTFRFFFRSEMSDLLSGYRVFSRRYVKSFPSTSSGFEIELEMSTHAVLLRMPMAEVETQYHPRQEGDESKLNTFRDGYRIMRRMMRFLRLHRPRFLYGLTAIAGAFVSLALAVPIILEFMNTGLVPRFPTAILSASIMTVSILVFSVGVILDSQAKYFAETKRLAYLRLKAPPQL